MTAGMVSPLQGFNCCVALTQGGALSRFALCYNIAPLQGFNTVIPAPIVIPAYAGISVCLLGDSGLRRNDGKKGMTGLF